MAKKRLIDYKFSHTGSLLFLTMIFLLFIIIAVLATLYATGVLSNSNTFDSVFSISSANCVNGGVYVTLNNNLNQPVSVAFVSFNGLNNTLPLLDSLDDSAFSIAAKGSIELHTNAYSCPAFNSLKQVKINVDYNSSSTAVYTFGNNFWIYVLTNNIQISETAGKTTVG